jgi:cellulose 1,4-beta-cellobiosidase
LTVRAKDAYPSHLRTPPPFDAAFTTYTCDATGACTPENSEIVLDANWRWLNKMGTSTNCYTGDEWDTGICPDPVTCAKNCGLEGADYPGTYGINIQGDSMSIKLVTVGQYDTNIGARTYVMDTPDTYRQYKLKNREFTFDVDVSTQPCGINGALYFVDMDADGGMSRFPTNAAGARYGTVSARASALAPDRTRKARHE